MNKKQMVLTVAFMNAFIMGCCAYSISIVPDMISKMATFTVMAAGNFIVTNGIVDSYLTETENK